MGSSFSLVPPVLLVLLVVLLLVLPLLLLLLLLQLLLLLLLLFCSADTGFDVKTCSGNNIWTGSLCQRPMFWPENLFCEQGFETQNSKRTDSEPASTRNLRQGELP